MNRFGLDGSPGGRGFGADLASTTVRRTVPVIVEILNLDLVLGCAEPRNRGHHGPLEWPRHDLEVVAVVVAVLVGLFGVDREGVLPTCW